MARVYVPDVHLGWVIGLPVLAGIARFVIETVQGLDETRGATG